MTRQLYHSDGRPVQIGDTVTSFRGEPYIVTGWATDGRDRVNVRPPTSHRSSRYAAQTFNLAWDQLQALLESEKG